MRALLPALRVLFVCVFASPAWAAEDQPKFPIMDDGREILSKSDELVRVMRSITYDAEVSLGSPQEPDTLKLSGNTAILCPDKKKPAKYLMTADLVAAKNKTMDGKVSVASTGTSYFAIDYNAKSFYQSQHPAQLPPRAQIAAPIIWPEFVHPRPFADELNGSIELSGSEDVKGVDCYKILVRYQRGGQTSTWWIGKSDLLPRRCEKILGEDANMIRQVCTIFNLKVDPELKDEQFSLTAPEGFTRVEPKPPAGG